jgi:hypothetical protein
VGRFDAPGTVSEIVYAAVALDVVSVVDAPDPHAPITAVTMPVAAAEAQGRWMQGS